MGAAAFDHAHVYLGMEGFVIIAPTCTDLDYFYKVFSIIDFCLFKVRIFALRVDYENLCLVFLNDITSHMAR